MRGWEGREIRHREEGGRGKGREDVGDVSIGGMEYNYTDLLWNQRRLRTPPIPMFSCGQDCVFMGRLTERQART